MKEIVVNDLMQSNYRYVIKEKIGKNFHNEFKPQLTPDEMLSLGVFGVVVGGVLGCRSKCLIWVHSPSPPSQPPRAPSHACAVSASRYKWPGWGRL